MSQLEQFEPIWSVGLMTGTVLDGNIDIALIKTDGVSIFETGAYALKPYAPGITDMLDKTLSVALQWQFDGPEPALFSEVERIITQAQSDAVVELLDDSEIALRDIGIVGFHGQTVLHRAPKPGAPGRTRQLGDGELMSRRLGVPVAFDFRSADMAAGGQGAPLAAIYHTALLRGLDSSGSTAVLNLGGVANITWWDGEDKIIAFDTGPANAPLNDFVQQHGLGRMDFNGELAEQGQVDETRLKKLLQHPYLAKQFPKSLDRFDFSKNMAEGFSVEDGAALLTAFSAAAVGCALDILPKRPTKLVVCGGGRRNPALLKALEQRASVEIMVAEAVGWRGDATEAECFAFLAVRSLRGLPLSFPSTTGVKQPLTGGRLAGVQAR